MNLPVPDLLYRCPDDLTVTQTPLKRLMVIGQCFVGGWPGVIKGMHPGCECDYFLFNNALQLPEDPPYPAEDYDFQLIHLPLRSVLPDGAYFRLSYNDIEAYESLFDSCTDRIVQFLSAAMQWNKKFGLLTFVTGFLIPQTNPMGRLLPRYDLRNFVYFIEKLNEFLANHIQQYRNSYFFDFDQIANTFGKKYAQDDGVWQINHNAVLTNGDFEKDGVRLEPVLKATDLYPSQSYLYVKAGWTELLAMYRTIRQIDMVKLVVVDIDDTLWRGVAAELSEHTADMIEGWPLGLAETLGHLKRRGVLLAIISKNEYSNVEGIWSKLFNNRLSMKEDFVSCKINWQPKAENLEEILRETNLLARNVIFIDDNPVERASIKAAFPDIRTLGPTPLTWRRILLWSSETQVPSITAESSSRTDMVRAQVGRETQRKQLSRAEFLASLNLKVDVSELSGADDSRFPRALELVNKSNQFNTTGRRWTTQECVAAFADNSYRFFVFDVSDVFTQYGTVGVVIVRDHEISQFVMSCRVVGMEVEIGVFSTLLPAIAESSHAVTLTAILKHTELNLLARDLYGRCGFVHKGDDLWTKEDTAELPRPAHIEISVNLLETVAVLA